MFFHLFRSRKIDITTFIQPEHLNPKVRLKNIWNELADVGVAVNLLPIGDFNNTFSIRYNTKTQSLFNTEEIADN